MSFDSPSELQLVFGLDAVHLLGEAGEGVVGLGGLLGGAGDDQRRARLVDQDVVDLVDDREVVAALDAVLERVGHVVAQVVEAELRVGAVDDVAGVLALARRVVVALLDRRDADPERVVDRLHPFGVAAGEVVVDGDEVDAVAGERVEEDGKRRGQRLALARLHLGDRALVQDHAADQLHVVVALADRAPRRLAGQREGLGQQVVERLAASAPARAGRRPPARSSASSSSSISGSIRLIASARFSYSLNLRPSPTRSARVTMSLAAGIAQG